MRHIVISIILVFTFLSNFGQTQQTLKNGFVAATDNGVWYWQKDFREWVQLDIDTTQYSHGIKGDTVIGISYSGRNLYGHYRNIGSFGGVIAVTEAHIIHGNKISNFYEYSALNGEYRFDTKTILSNFKYKKSCVMYTELGSNSRVYCKIDNYEFGYTAFQDGDELRYFTSMSSDNDSIFCLVGTNNSFAKMIMTTGTKSYTSVPGLHSRPTDSHQICYNPDDDEFIIVSDSGIVYSYDKTTLTTIDTLASSSLALDILYCKYDMNYYIHMGSRIYITNDFINYNDGYLGSGNTYATMACSPRNFGFTSSGYVIFINNQTDYIQNVAADGSIFGTTQVPDFPVQLKVFELDYIEYNP